MAKKPANATEAKTDTVKPKGSLKETLKTIALTATIVFVGGFISGVIYQGQLTQQTQAQVLTQVQAVKK